MSDMLHAILRVPVDAPPSEAARATARLSLLDWLACGVAGQDEPVATLLRDMLAEEGGAPVATGFGGLRLPPRAAALLNGTVSHALDYDDTHFAHIGHPSVAVFPAALAMAERVGADLSAMLDAALRGMEASVRFGLLFGRGHYQVGFHQTATAGAFGAAVAACLLVRPGDHGVLHQALGLVSTRASGLKSQFGSMGKPFNAGLAASNGVEAALLAARGFVSDPAALDGVNGFLATHHADGQVPDSDAWLFEAVRHKMHACCHGLHATLEALATLAPVDPHVVEAVEITTHPRWMTVCNQPAPTTGLGAKFSYRTVTALALLGHDTAALDTYRDALATAPDVCTLRDRVAVTTDDTLTEMQARVRLNAGGTWSEAVFDLDAPIPTEVLRQRIEAKARSLMGRTRADQAVAAIAAGDLAELVGLM